LLLLGFVGGCAINDDNRSDKLMDSYIQGDVDYFLEPDKKDLRPSETYHRVHLRLPKALYSSPPAANRPLRGEGVTLTMFYPNFSGIADNHDINCLTLILVNCRQRLSADLELKTADYDDATWAHMMLDVILKSKSISLVQKPSSYQGLELVGIGSEVGVKSNRRLHGAVYLSRNPRGQPNRVIYCTETEGFSYPVCFTYFSLERAPGVQVRLNFALDLLQHWEQLIQGVRAKIDNMVVKDDIIPVPLSIK
jgi:hypothetical protein